MRNAFCSPCDEFCISVNADAIMAGYLTTGNCCVDDSLASLCLGWRSEGFVCSLMGYCFVSLRLRSQ